MPTLELMPGIKPEDALKAFETIYGELEKVRPLNYRSPLFTRWKTIVGTALAKFAGPEHAYTKAFSGFVFHGPMPKSPMDPPVSPKDVEGYAEGMKNTEVLLQTVIEALRPPTPSAEVPPLTVGVDPGLSVGPAPVPAIPAAPAAPPADTGFKVVHGHGTEVGRAAPGSAPTVPVAPAGDSLRSTHDLSRHAGTIPAGGLKIVSRSNTGGAMTTLESFVEAAADPQEKELLAAIARSVDDPGVTWDVMKQLLAELWWLKRETVQKILPIILRR